MKRCKKCFLPKNYPNIKLNEKGICNYCLESRVIIREGFDTKATNAKRMKLKKDFEKFIKSIKGKSEYDCLLLFSGGKDSTYLLYLLKEKYGLNVLTLSVDTGLERETTKNNIKRIVKHFDVDHILFVPENDFYKRFYKYYLKNPGNATYCDTICGLCSSIMHSIGLNIAAEMKIPFVALGYSPEQAYCYEFSKEKLSKSWVPKELYNESFSEKDRGYFWNPKNVNKKNIPRFILPFYVLDYPGVENIIEELSELGLRIKKKLDPLKSNCYLVFLLMHLDLIKYGYTTYSAHISSLIRAGNLREREKYIIILTLGAWLLKHGLVKQRNIKRALDHLELKMEDII